MVRNTTGFWFENFVFLGNWVMFNQVWDFKQGDIIYFWICWSRTSSLTDRFPISRNSTILISWCDLFTIPQLDKHQTSTTSSWFQTDQYSETNSPILIYETESKKWWFVGIWLAITSSLDVFQPPVEIQILYRLLVAKGPTMWPPKRPEPVNIKAQNCRWTNHNINHPTYLFSS